MRFTMKLPDHHAGLGLLVIIIAAGLDLIVMYRGLPSGVDGNITSVILTAWNGLATAVVNWAFGSSSQTARQAELLAAATPATKPNVAQAAADAQSTADQSPRTQ
jgi:hypothetical protein